MRVAKLALLSLVIVCCGCSRSGTTGTGGEPESWREIARFEGDSQTWTSTFTIETAYWRASWETQPDAEGNKEFVVDVRKTLHAVQSTESVVAADGPSQGSKIININGKMYFVIHAKQPWVVWVEVPE